MVEDQSLVRVSTGNYNNRGNSYTNNNNNRNDFYDDGRW